MNLVFIERESFGTDISIEKFSEFGNVTTYPVLDVEHMAEQAKDADILFINKAPCNEKTLGQASHLKLICEMATGFDNVDVAWCHQKGIAVANVPNYSTASVAQHAVTLTLALLGKLVHYDNVVKSGYYASQPQFTIFDQPITELEGKTWGIAGLGNIGSVVARVAAAFGCRVITYSPSGRVHTDSPYESVSFDELLVQSDILSLHCPHNASTDRMMDAEAFRKMKNSAVFINVSRGKLVDQQALVDALNAGEIAGAGLDVMVTEPMEPNDPLLTIQDSSRLIVTPHVAWASIEARQRDVDITFENVRSFLKGEPQNLQ